MSGEKLRHRCIYVGKFQNGFITLAFKNDLRSSQKSVTKITKKIPEKNIAKSKKKKKIPRALQSFLHFLSYPLFFKDIFPTFSTFIEEIRDIAPAFLFFSPDSFPLEKEEWKSWLVEGINSANVIELLQSQTYVVRLKLAYWLWIECYVSSQERPPFELISRANTAMSKLARNTETTCVLLRDSFKYIPSFLRILF